MVCSLSCNRVTGPAFVRAGLLGGLVSISLTLLGCGESADTIAIRKHLKEQQLASPAIVQNAQPKPVREWSGRTNALIAPGVYGLGGLDPSAAYAIDTGEGLVLIDTGLDEQAVGLRECLMEVGLDLRDVKYVLLTHAHYDHVFGSNFVREYSNATVCAGADDCDVLRNADRFALFSLFPKVPFSGTPILVDRALRDGDTIELGGTIIHAIACPGHTPGSMCYLIQSEGGTILFSGDVIASLRFGPATYPVFISPKFRGDAESYLATIDQLLAMPPPKLLLTGHPRQQLHSRFMKMDSDQWRELLLPARQELQMVVRRHREDGADFLDAIAKQIEDGLFYFGDLDSIAVYGVFREDKFLVVHAPGGERFMAWLEQQLKSLGLETRPPDAVLLTTLEEHACSGMVSLPATTQVMTPGMRPFEIADKSWPLLDRANFRDLVSIPLEVIAIGDPTTIANAYVFEISDKRVLMTASGPRNISLDWITRKSGTATASLIQPQAEELRSLMESSESERQNYTAMLDAVADWNPNIWLPSRPLTGQNANLYDQTWSRIILANRSLVDSNR